MTEGSFPVSGFLRLSSQSTCPAASGTGRCLTHTDGVGGVQFAAERALAVEGACHVAAHSVDTWAGEALVDI